MVRVLRLTRGDVHTMSQENPQRGDALYGFFKWWRERQGLKIREFARAAKVNDDTYSGFEGRQIKILGLENILDLLSYLGLSAGVLDELRGKKTAADGAEVAKRIASRQGPRIPTLAERRDRRQRLADAVRADPTNDDAVDRYIDARLADAMYEGLTPEQIERDLRVELRLLGYRAATDEGS